MTDPELSIVLPCYNEESNLSRIFSAFEVILEGLPNVEIVLVDNGSTDETNSIIRAFVNNKKQFSMCHVKVNQGYGYGIMQGIRIAKGNFIAWTHADLQTDPMDVIKAFDKIKGLPNAENIFLKGKRVGRSSIDAFFTFGMSIISSISMLGIYSDVNAQPKLFHKSFVPKLDNPPDDFSLDLYAIFIAKRYGMQELTHKVLFHQRIHGLSKGGGTIKGKLKLIVRTLIYIAKLRKRELLWK